MSRKGLPRALRVALACAVVACLAYVFTEARPSISDADRLALVEQKYSDRRDEACRRLGDVDDQLSGRPLTRPYEKSILWDTTWRPSRPELAPLAETACGPAAWQP